MHDPAFPHWMAQVQAMPAEEQITAVSKKLVELNSGFDGKDRAHNVQGNVVTELSLEIRTVTDLSPIRSLHDLKTLNMYAAAVLTDLSPL